MWTIELEKGGVFEGETQAEVLDQYVNFFTQEDGANNIKAIYEVDEFGKLVFNMSREFISKTQFQLDEQIRVNLRNIEREKGSLKGE